MCHVILSFFHVSLYDIACKWVASSHSLRHSRSLQETGSVRSGVLQAEETLAMCADFLRTGVSGISLCWSFWEDYWAQTAFGHAGACWSVTVTSKGLQGWKHSMLHVSIPFLCQWLTAILRAMQGMFPAAPSNGYDKYCSHRKLPVCLPDKQQHCLQSKAWLTAWRFHCRIFFLLYEKSKLSEKKQKIHE